MNPTKACPICGTAQDSLLICDTCYENVVQVAAKAHVAYGIDPYQLGSRVNRRGEWLLPGGRYPKHGTGD